MNLSGNLATGWIMGSTGSYSLMFGITAALYLTAWAAFAAFMQGDDIRITQPAVK